MPASAVHPNKAIEKEPERVPPDQAGDTKVKAAPSTEQVSEERAAPVSSTSAFKPDPFW